MNDIHPTAVIAPGVKLGDRVRIGPYAIIQEDCEIGDDCWIGTRVTILDGAQSVGDRALVAACALVNKPVPARTIVGGVPAKTLSASANRPN